MSSVETQGSTIEEAIASALAQLQAERDQVEIEIIAQATKGFLGIGGKKARVRATLRSPLAPQELEPESMAVDPAERPVPRRSVSSASDAQPAPVPLQIFAVFGEP